VVCVGALGVWEDIVVEVLGCGAVVLWCCGAVVLGGRCGVDQLLWVSRAWVVDAEWISCCG
jgi:hypothetical protein